jgi:hypothetical protein
MEHLGVDISHRPMEKLGKVHTKTLYQLQKLMDEFNFEIRHKFLINTSKRNNAKIPSLDKY